MVNEKFWELVGNEPESLVKAREEYSLSIDIPMINLDEKIAAYIIIKQNNYIRELEARIKLLEGK